MTEKDPLDPRFLDLASRFLDGVANAEELETLAAILKIDPRAVSTLSELLNQHGTLALSLRGEAAYRETTSAPPRPGGPAGTSGSIRRTWWMAIPIAACIAIIATVALYHGQSPVSPGIPGRPTPSVLSFQEGVLPSPEYRAARDSKISEHRPSQRFGREATLEVEGGDGEGESAALLRWDLSQLPAGSEILSATVTLTVSRAREKDTLYKIWEVTHGWSEEQVTWTQAEEGVPWEVPGAKGVRDRGPSALAEFRARKGTLRIPLNAGGLAALGRWVRSSGENHGLVITFAAEEGEFYFASRKAEMASTRPLLTVTYSPPKK